MPRNSSNPKRFTKRNTTPKRNLAITLRDGDVPTNRKADLETSTFKIPPIPVNYRFCFLDAQNSAAQASAAGVTSGAVSWTHSASCAQSSTMLSLFDQYKIIGVVVDFVPRQNVSVVQAGANTPTCLFTVIDYDDDSAITSQNAMQQRNNCTMTQVWESVRRSFRPHVAIAAYSGAFTSFANQQSQWIDSGSPSVKHYSVKWFMPQAPANLIPTFDIICRLYVEYRNVF